MEFPTTWFQIWKENSSNAHHFSSVQSVLLLCFDDDTGSWQTFRHLLSDYKLIVYEDYVHLATVCNYPTTL